MKKTICLLLVLLMALTMVGCGETTLGAETGDIVSETEQATPTDAAIPEQTFTPERENPMILYSSADEYDFRMELYDANWTYERPSQEGQSYVITNASFRPDHALILTGRMDFDGDDMTADELDEVNDYLLESINSDSNGTIHVLERTEYPVGNCRGRALLGRIAWDDIADCCVDTYIITWVKKETASNRLFIYYLIATADPPAFDATVSEANLMLLSFQTTDEYSRNGEAELPEGVVRGCAYDIPYSNAVCLENEDGSHSVQVIIQIRNTGTIPIWVAGSSSFEVKDSEEKLVCSCPFALPSPDILLPGESSLAVYWGSVENIPATNDLTVIPDIHIQESTNACNRYDVSKMELRDTPDKGLELTGVLENRSSYSAVDYVYIYVNLYNSDHHPIGQLFTIMQERLIPGEKTAITATGGLSSPFVKSEDVAYYEVFAYPLQYQN